MRKGCVVFTVLVALGIAIAGFFAYSYISDSLDIPDELAEYGSHNDALSHITSTAPAPGPEARITEEKIQALFGAFDSIQAGWRITVVAIDSLANIGDAADSNELHFLTMPQFIRQAMIGVMTTRKGLVAHLNSVNLSWEEYLWLKTRVIAAAGIEKPEADSSFNLTLPPTLAVRNKKSGFGDSERANEQFFDNVNRLRSIGVIDSGEIALARRHRAALLTRGSAALKGMEESKTGLNMGASFKSNQE